MDYLLFRSLLKVQISLIYKSLKDILIVIDTLFILLFSLSALESTLSVFFVFKKNNKFGGFCLFSCFLLWKKYLKGEDY